MSLARKVSIIVVLVFVLSAIAGVCIQKLFILPSFIILEKETALKNAERVVGAIGREIDQIVPSVTDWATWTDTYEFVKGDNTTFLEDNLDDGETLQGLNMNFMGIYDISGKTVWRQGLNSQGGEEVNLGELSQEGLPASHPLLQHTELLSVVKGILMSSHGPLMVVSEPIIANEKEGPIAGVLVLGRLFDGSAVERMSKLTRLSIKLKAIEEGLAPPVWVGIDEDPSALKHSGFSWVETAESWQVNTIIADIFGKSVLTLQVETQRGISAQGEKAVLESLWVWFTIGLVTMWLLWYLLQRAVLQPIDKLTQHAQHIGENCDFSHVHFGPKRDDEIGVLAHSFDLMVDRLAETRSRLMDQSYQSGVAETASGVLHNIGNALTPLNIRLSTLLQRCKNTPVPEMKQTVAELADPAVPEERRADLLQFQQLAWDEINLLFKEGLEEIDASLQQVRLLEDILNDQQRFSRSSRVIEPVDMAAVIKDVEVDFGPELQKVLRVEVGPSVLQLGPVAGSRAALQQLVANLLLNASESIQQTAVRNGVVTVTAASERWQGKPVMALFFQDNGGGIDPRHLESLFERGFSTKERDGSGYGLHWCANTIQSLGGLISAENNKDGCGACVKLLLPLVEKPVSHGVHEGR